VKINEKDGLQRHPSFFKARTEGQEKAGITTDHKNGRTGKKQGKKTN